MELQNYEISAHGVWLRLDNVRGKISLRELAETGGIKYQRLKDQRSTERMPSLRDLYVMSRILGVTVDYLISGEGAQPISPEARLVEDDLEMRALVRAVDGDRRLLSVISSVVLSYEDRECKKA